MSSKNDDTPLNRIRRGIINLERTDPFFSSLILNLKLIEDTSISTMGTNGRDLRYNPEFVNNCNPLSLDVILTHEAAHVAFGHPILLTKLPNMQTALIAAELAVNSLLYTRKGFPDDVLVPSMGDYAHLPLGKNTEWYYNELSKSEKSNPKGQGKEDDVPNTSNSDDQSGESSTNNQSNESTDSQDKSEHAQDNNNQTPTSNEISNTKDEGGSGTSSAAINEVNKLGSVSPYEYAEDETPQIAERQWEQIVSEAANQAAAAGNLPGAFEELVNRLLGTTKLPWTTLLRLFLTRNIRRGRSYRRPNRRTLSRADIQPSKLTKGLGKVVFGVDTSGSMDQTEMNQALSACIDIGKAYSDFELGIIQFDTVVTKEEWFTRFNARKDIFNNWNWKGRGGTYYGPVFDRVKEIKPDIVVIVTDGYPCGPWPDMRTLHIPVIWLITKECRVPDVVRKHSKVIEIK